MSCHLRNNGKNSAYKHFLRKFHQMNVMQLKLFNAMLGMALQYLLVTKIIYHYQLQHINDIQYYTTSPDRSWSQGQVLSGHSFKENLITIAQIICLSEFLTLEIPFSDTFQVNISQRCNNKLVEDVLL